MNIFFIFIIGTSTAALFWRRHFEQFLDAELDSAFSSNGAMEFPSWIKYEPNGSNLNAAADLKQRIKDSVTNYWFNICRQTFTAKECMNSKEI